MSTPLHDEHERGEHDREAEPGCPTCDALMADEPRVDDEIHVMTEKDLEALMTMGPPVVGTSWFTRPAGDVYIAPVGTPAPPIDERPREPWRWLGMGHLEWAALSPEERAAARDTFAVNFGRLNEALEDFGRAIAEALTPALEKLGAILNDPTVQRLIRKARRRERYNAKMSARAREDRR